MAETTRKSFDILSWLDVLRLDLTRLFDEREDNIKASIHIPIFHYNPNELRAEFERTGRFERATQALNQLHEIEKQVLGLIELARHDVESQLADEQVADKQVEIGSGC